MSCAVSDTKTTLEVTVVEVRSGCVSVCTTSAARRSVVVEVLCG